MKKLYVQYGCGLRAVPGWINYDASPTLIIQKIPVVGYLMQSKLNCKFDKDVLYGDIVHGLKIKSNSVDGVFCSHVLEHLGLEEFDIALKNTYEMLKPGAIFRCIVPDLELFVREYSEAIKGNSESKNNAAIQFCKNTYLGLQKKKRGFSGILFYVFGNSKHLWMWDRYSLKQALVKHGFSDIEEFQQGSSPDEMFLRPENAYQFHKSIGFQCKKPV